MQELPAVTELGPKTTFVGLISLSALCQRTDAFLALFHSQSPSSTVLCEGHKGSQCIWWSGSTESRQLSS